MTDWFIKYPCNNFMPSQDEEGMTLISNELPDWVKIPDNLGGGIIRCLGQHIDVCPIHPEHQIRHFDLEGEIQVAECQIEGFLWYRKKI